MKRQYRIQASGLIIIGMMVFLTVLTGCVHPASRSDGPGRPVAMINGVLIDGTGRDAVEDAIVVYRGNQIEAAGPGRQIVIPADAEIIDLGGATILPGFINTHVHFAYDEETLTAFAQAGITTVRDMQDSDSERMDDWSWFERRDELTSDPQNSRLLSVGPMITVPGGYPVYMGDETEKALIVSSAEEAERVTQRLIEDGADTIKIAVENGITFYVDKMFGYLLPSLSPEEIEAIVSVAHQNGVKVAAHITNTGDLPAFLDAGGDEIAHMVVDNGLTDELIARIVDAGVYWGPTLELYTYVEQAPFVLEVDPDYQSRLPAIKNLERYVRAGGKVILGSDFGGMPGGVQFQYMPMIELEAMLEAGMTPMQVIEAATINAASACNRADDLGTLESGKIADILVVEGNPLEDIRSLERPVMVVRDGIIIRNEGLSP